MPEPNWTAIGVIIAILAHAGTWIWWASKMSTTMQSIALSLARLDKELEKRDKELEKRDNAIAKLWERIDEVRDMIK